MIPERFSVMPAKAGIQSVFRFLSSRPRITDFRGRLLPGSSVFLRRWIPAFAGMTGLMLVSACESLGDGNRLEKIEIVPVDGVPLKLPDGAPADYRVYECLRHPMSLVGTFSNGSRGGFTGRARWSSDNPDVVAVTTGDEVLPEQPSLRFGRGVLRVVNHGGTASSEVVTITAEFAGLKTSIRVTPGRPENMRLIAASDPPGVTKAQTEANPVAIAAGADLQLAARVDLDARPIEISDLLTFFVDEDTFENKKTPCSKALAERGNPAATFCLLIRDAADAIFRIKPKNILTGLRPDGGTPLTARAEFNPADDTCVVPDETAHLFATREVRVGVVSNLRIEHEEVRDNVPNFYEEPGNPTDQGRLVVGNNEILKVIADLDFGGGDPAAGSQDLAGQTLIEELCEQDDASLAPCTVGQTRFQVVTVQGISSSRILALRNATEPVMDAEDPELVAEPGIDVGTPSFFRASYTCPDMDSDTEVENFGDCSSDPEGTYETDTSFSIVPVAGTLTSIAAVPGSPGDLTAFQALQFDAVGTFCVLWDEMDETICDEELPQMMTRVLGSVPGTAGIGWTVFQCVPDEEGEVPVEVCAPSTAAATIVNNGSITNGRLTSHRVPPDDAESEQVIVRLRASNAGEDSAANDNAGLAACETDPLCDVVEVTIVPPPAP
jgi:hypothetical protein